MNQENGMIDGRPCWNAIGVWAPESPSCPKLKEHVHCSNCEVFVAKGRELFEREPSSEYLKEWAKLLAEPRLDGSGGGESILVFRLEEEWLAFPTSAFKFVADVSRIHSIPHKSDALLLGLANAGDALRLCFSLKALLGIEQGPAPAVKEGSPMKAPRHLALERGGHAWLFQADEVLGVFNYDSKSVRNTPSTVSKANPSFVRKVLLLDGRSVGLLDDELVVFALNRSLQ